MSEVPTTYQTTDLATVPELTPAKWRMIEQIARAAGKSRMFRGVTSAEQAAIVMLKGFEIGIGLTAAFEFIQPIQGKFELIPRGALALLHSSPLIEKIELERLEENGEFSGYSCTIRRTNGFEFTATYTLKDAEQAGLLKPDSGWVKYPEIMCRWRAIGFAADVAASDITSGMTAIMKMPEHYGIVIDEEGNVIDGEWGTAQSTPTPAISEPAPQITLNDLLGTYDAASVLKANGGKIPGTNAEVAAVARKLGGAQ